MQRPNSFMELEKQMEEKVFCSRFVNEHMVAHGLEEGHVMCLSYSDLSVWCYGCDNYVDNQVLCAAKNAAHLHKFGQSLT